MLLGRNGVIEILAQIYFIFLNHLDFNNEIYMKGMKEARTKFLANTQIYLTTKDLPRRKKDRRYSTDFVSENALRKLKNFDTS